MKANRQIELFKNMQLRKYDQHFKNARKFEFTILSDIIDFQNDEQKQQFESLFQNPESSLNKNPSTFTKRSSSCSNKNGNLGDSSYFQSKMCISVNYHGIYQS